MDITLKDVYEHCKRKINIYPVGSNMYQEHKMFMELIEKEEKRRWNFVEDGKLPDPEKEVEIAYEGCDGNYYTARAFYENGMVHSEDSMMSCTDWCTWSDWCEYDEETDDWIIPMGWLEYVSFGDEYAIIDKKVIAWREIEEFVYQEKNIPEKYNEIIMKSFTKVR